MRHAGRMKTLSMDLRERIVASYDAGEGTMKTIAERYRAAFGMVDKLLHQRRRTGSIAPRRRSGRRPKILEEHRRRMRQVVERQPDATLRELRDELELGRALPAIHCALARMRLTYKKKRFGQASGTGRTSSPPGANGAKNRNGRMARDSSSSTNLARKPI